MTAATTDPVLSMRHITKRFFGTTVLDDVEVMASIARITNGNFRLLQRLFSQVQRILEINQLTRVTEEVVQAARESLVIGPT